MKNKEIIIAGSSGFLGKNVLRQFSNHKEIIALTSDTKKLLEFERYSNIKVMTNTEFFERNHNFGGAILVNLAYSRSHEYKEIKSSIDFTADIITRAIFLGTNKIVNISSQSVYDPYRKYPAKENDIIAPMNLYGIGKYYIEKLLVDISDKYGIGYVNLRIGSLVGPELKERLINRLITKALFDQSLQLIEKGNKLSYTHVSDISKAIELTTTINDKLFWNNLYNLGSDECYRITDIGKTIAEEIKIKTDYDLELQIIEELEENTQNNTIDVRKFKMLTGWKEDNDLRSIISGEIDFQLEENYRCIENI